MIPNYRNHLLAQGLNELGVLAKSCYHFFDQITRSLKSNGNNSQLRHGSIIAGSLGILIDEHQVREFPLRWLIAAIRAPFTLEGRKDDITGALDLTAKSPARGQEPMDHRLKKAGPGLDGGDSNSSICGEGFRNVQPFGVAAELRAQQCSCCHLGNQGQYGFRDRDAMPLCL